MTEQKAEIGIFGGSGLYSLLKGGETIDVETKYGKTSDSITIGELEGRKVAFMPRHGSKHHLPPHRVPYRANIDAMKKLGVTRLISTSAVGSLRMDFMPGDFVFPNQFINFSHGRDETFFDEETVAHISAADPYCSEMRQVAIMAGDVSNVKYHPNGTVIVVNGPRFSTRAESKFFRSIGGDIVNMTQYPEIVLAKECSMCFLGVTAVTNYDAGIDGNREIAPVTFNVVSTRLGSSIEKMKNMLSEIIRSLPEQRSCSCKDSLVNAAVGSPPEA